MKRTLSLNRTVQYFNSIRSLTTLKNEDVAVISTRNGKVAGKLQTSSKTQQQFFAFKGIPYAEPAVGDLNFAPPIPVNNWSGVKECFNDVSVCPQPFTRQPCSEDCLYLNVYTPKTVVEGKLPVMIFIQGGAFVQGGTSLQSILGPDYLLNEDVVVVTFNYRIGFHGYMTTEDDILPPNIAAKDQFLVMKWVKENIHNFGGDSENITIFAQSAGAVHASEHLTNPKTNGFYKGMILQSGTMMCRWGYNQTPGVMRKRAFKVGKLLGCDTNSSKELLQFLRKQPFQAILSTQLKCMDKIDHKMGIYYPFQPIAEANEPTFRDRFRNGQFNKVPVIVGANSHEGFFMINGYLKRLEPEERLAMNNKNPVYMVKRLVPKAAFTNGLAEELDRTVRQFYFGNREFTMDNIYDYLQEQSDSGFHHARHETVKHLINAGIPTYLFNFSYDGEFGQFRRQHTTKIKGVTHNDDLCYLFNTKVPKPAPKLPFDASEHLARKRFIKMWTNFAKYQNPTPSNEKSDLLPVIWERFTVDNPKYMDLGEEPIVRPYNLDCPRMKLWDEVYERARNETKISKPTSKIVDLAEVHTFSNFYEGNEQRLSASEAN